MGAEAIGTRKVPALAKDGAASEDIPSAARGGPLPRCRCAGEVFRNAVDTRSGLVPSRGPPAVHPVWAAPLAPIPSPPCLGDVIDHHAMFQEERAQLIRFLELARSPQQFAVKQQVVDVASRDVRGRRAGGGTLHETDRLVVALRPARCARGQATERSTEELGRSRLPSSRIARRTTELLFALGRVGSDRAGAKTNQSHSAGVPAQPPLATASAASPHRGRRQQEAGGSDAGAQQGHARQTLHHRVRRSRDVLGVSRTGCASVSVNVSVARGHKLTGAQRGDPRRVGAARGALPRSAALGSGPNICAGAVPGSRPKARAIQSTLMHRSSLEGQRRRHAPHSRSALPRSTLDGRRPRRV